MLADETTLLEQIQLLEQEARKLEPTTEQRVHWNQRITQYAGQFIEEIETRKAYDQDDDEGRGLQELEITDTPKAIEQIIATVGQNVDRAGINPASGGHFGYIPGGGIYTTALGDYLAAVSNRYSGIFFANPNAVRIENQMIRWMCKMVGYPDTALGNLASGGSIANLIAIVTARDYHGIKAKAMETAVIYLTGQVHHCVQKAIRIAGMQEAIIREMPMNERYQMDVEQLQKRIKADKQQGLRPFLVVASAGTTDTGAIDPLNQIADLAEQHQLWFHVDAAYGGFFMLLPEFRAEFRGIERSDSLAIDPHKGLFLSYGLGALLIKNVEAQFKAHYYQANYMQDAMPVSFEPSPADLSPELTKHFRGMRMWLSLHLLGLSPFKATLREKVYLCRYFYEKIQQLGFEVGPYPELSVAIYRYLPKNGDPNAFNKHLVEFVQQDGRVFLSSTNIDGNYWIRLAVLSFRSHLREIDLCLEILQQGILALEK